MDPAKAQERVLVIPESRFQTAGAFTGFQPYTADYLAALLDPQFLSFRPRGQVETDPSFKQLIPYVLLHCRGEVFHYTRGGSSGEKRLQALRSIGIGGHISDEDGSPPTNPYRAGMMRELSEEVDIDSPYRENCLGFIYDPSTPVGEVHLGIVHILELDEARVYPREDAIADGSFSPVQDLLRLGRQFETWSQLVMAVLA